MVLYRKYRPKTFGEIVGQEHVVKTLQNALAQEKVAHAYLFTGPRGTGKTTAARLLAASLNCEKTKDRTEPCNSCERCTQMLAGQSLDLVEIDAASNRGIDEIRNLKESVRFASPNGEYKVYLVDEVHMLTKEAFNAFLKTLEEPPENVVFILATTEPHKLPATVISRTQRFDFRRLSISEIRNALAQMAKKEGVKADTEALTLVAREADGALRDAISLLEQVLSFSDKKITVETVEEAVGVMSHSRIRVFIDMLIEGKQKAAFSWVDDLVNAGQDIHQFLHALSRYLRLLIWVGLGDTLKERAEKEVGGELLAQMQKQAATLTPTQAARWLQLFTQAREAVESYPLPQMAVEVALVHGFTNNESGIMNQGSDTNNGDDIEEDRNNTESGQESKQHKNSAHTSNESNSSQEPMLASIQEQWDAITSQLKEYNHSLFAIAKAAEPKKIEKNTLTVTAQYAFNKDRLHDRKNRKVIEDAIEQHLGTRLRLRCVLKK